MQSDKVRRDLTWVGNLNEFYSIMTNNSIDLSCKLTFLSRIRTVGLRLCMLGAHQTSIKSSKP